MRVSAAHKVTMLFFLNLQICLHHFQISLHFSSGLAGSGLPPRQMQNYSHGHQTREHPDVRGRHFCKTYGYGGH